LPGGCAGGCAGGVVGEGRVAALHAALQTRHLLFRRPRLFSG
jgi:hypothetical protein